MTTFPPLDVAVYTLPPIVTSADGGAVIVGGLYMPDTEEKGIVRVTLALGSTTTRPDPLGASLSTIPFASVIGAPPTEIIVPLISTLVAVVWPLCPSPTTAVAVINSPFGKVITTPAVGVGALPGPGPMGRGTLIVDGAAPPGVEMMRCPGSCMEMVVPGPTVMAGAPGVRVLGPMVICAGFVGLITIGVGPMVPMVVGWGAGLFWPGAGLF